MSSDPCVWIVEPVLAGAAAAALVGASGPSGAVIRMAIPSSARPGRSRFAVAGGAGVLGQTAPAVCQPRVEVAVELGAVGEGDRGDDGGEDDREQRRAW